MTPRLPNAGTDNDVLLTALQAAHPKPLWNPSSKFRLTAHSRVSELRKMGWDIECVRRRTPSGVKKGKQQYGYVLATPRVEWPAADTARDRKVA